MFTPTPSNPLFIASDADTVVSTYFSLITTLYSRLTSYMIALRDLTSQRSPETSPVALEVISIEERTICLHIKEYLHNWRAENWWMLNAGVILTLLTPTEFEAILGAEWWENIVASVELNVRTMREVEDMVKMVLEWNGGDTGFRIEFGIEEGG
ncbi:hypothetical protein EJ04DRAFT_524542 [Polyplosphaeria fusca]|uniref:Uncharacterized protein n=1 Tax=Polyplosphaeria fusca TaxID=682080 RepID=A0A9P4QY70_9PLEO|nr:hypothetical protein EJ04DRAFT_524542 [Polyplosphaeria fusca]